MSPIETRMLEELADSDGIYRTDVIRLLVRRSHAKRFGKPGHSPENGAHPAEAE